jgi:hypothetical protein
MFSMKSTLIAMSCLVVVGMVACTTSPMRRVGTTGTAGTGTSAGTAGTGTSAGTAGTGTSAGTAGTQGTAGTGTSAGTAGDQGAAGAAGTTGTAGAAGGTAGDQGTAGAAGTTAGTAGAAGTTAGTAGAAGTTAGTGGGAGTGTGTCMNSTVVTAGGSETNCGAKTGWKATAMPTPPSKYLNIPDTALQPQYAIDGNTTTRYSSGMTMADGFYFQVDLGSAKMISGITVDTSEGADAMDVADGYDVGVSMDGTTFTSVASCMFNAAPMEVINFKATMGRYVRYTNKGAPGPNNGPTSWLSIHEFDILCN